MKDDSVFKKMHDDATFFICFQDESSPIHLIVLSLIIISVYDFILNKFAPGFSNVHLMFTHPKNIAGLFPISSSNNHSYSLFSKCISITTWMLLGILLAKIFRHCVNWDTYRHILITGITQISEPCWALDISCPESFTHF